MGYIYGVISLLFTLAIYFLPSILCNDRVEKGIQKNIGMVFFINLVFGWTGIGWLVALIMAYSKEFIDEKVEEVEEEIKFEHRPYTGGNSFEDKLRNLCD